MYIRLAGYWLKGKEASNNQQVYGLVHDRAMHARKRVHDMLNGRS